MPVTVKDVVRNSPAFRAGMLPGDRLVSINGNEVFDVLDYQFYQSEKQLEIRTFRGGKPLAFSVKKSQYSDLGLEFETYLMDKKHSCANHCVFCFVDQLPSGLRESLYFKDDDSRLSYLFGNYITLTNTTRREIDRMIRMKLTPVNISVHTTNPELRCRMMGNPRAGQCLEYLPLLAAGGISMNCQLVLCRGINDGEELRRSLYDLAALYPAVESIAVVPVGLTDHRQSLASLEPYDRESAREVVRIVEQAGDAFLKKFGVRLCYPADGFFILAQQEIPDADYYGEFAQLENGVGMIALFRQEIFQAIEDLKGKTVSPRTVSLATSVSAYSFICRMAEEIMNRWPQVRVSVYAIQNRLFGKKVDVAGLICGGDLIAGLEGKPLGEQLLFPAVMLRRERDLFLDDRTPEDVSRALGVPVHWVENNGEDFVAAVLGLEQ